MILYVLQQAETDIKCNIIPANIIPQLTNSHKQSLLQSDFQASVNRTVLN